MIPSLSSPHGSYRELEFRIGTHPPTPSLEREGERFELKVSALVLDAHVPSLEERGGRVHEAGVSLSSCVKVTSSYRICTKNIIATCVNQA